MPARRPQTPALPLLQLASAPTDVPPPAPGRWPTAGAALPGGCRLAGSSRTPGGATACPRARWCCAIRRWRWPASTSSSTSSSGAPTGGPWRWRCCAGWSAGCPGTPGWSPGSPAPIWPTSRAARRAPCPASWPGRWRSSCWRACEAGATAEFLGTETNRAPSYVLIAPAGHGPCGGTWQSPRLWRLGNKPSARPRAQRSPRPEPLAGLRPAPPAPQSGCGPSRPCSSAPGSAPRVVRWRAVAMLGPWFDAGWCVAGLLHALEHHPDHPETRRGDAARAARDPLRVVGHRLAPWQGRLADLPARLAAVDGPARRARAAALAEADTTPATTPATATGQRPTAAATARAPASAPARAAARAQMSRVLSRPRVHKAATGRAGRSPSTAPSVRDH